MGREYLKLSPDGAACEALYKALYELTTNALTQPKFLRSGYTEYITTPCSALNDELRLGTLVSKEQWVLRYAANNFRKFKKQNHTTGKLLIISY